LCPSDPVSGQGPITTDDDLGVPSGLPASQNPYNIPATSGADYGSGLGSDWMPTGVTNYKGVAGDNWGLYGSPVSNPVGGTTNPAWVNGDINGNTDGIGHGDGMFWQFPSSTLVIRIADITDGTSNTFMVGESLVGRNNNTSWCFANDGYATCAIPPNARFPDGTVNNPYDWPNGYGFHSQHTNGVNFVMADGSVHYVTQSIALPLYRALATRAQGEVASLP
jgi:prepilin-type processing-associated H-X9-DG protein